uniref:Helix-turn-helix domain-containing protein n=1 Tax=candidate division WOR-3 bacterium TaxID=2052148 RepID=A0A7C3Z2D7_UNCW3
MRSKAKKRDMSKGWTKLPNYLWEIIPELNETALKVLLFLLRASFQNRCYTSQKTISQRIKKSRLSVNRALKILEKKGIIENHRYLGRISFYRVRNPEEKNPPAKGKISHQYQKGEVVNDFAICPNCQFSNPIATFPYVAHSRDGKKEFLLCENCRNVFWILTER